MSYLFDKFYTNKDLEANGVWVKVLEGRVKLARSSIHNPKWLSEQKNEAQYIKENYPGCVNAEDFEPDVADYLAARMLVKTCVRGWQYKNEDGEYVDGIPYKQGEVLPYSQENAIKVLAKLSDLANMLSSRSTSMLLFQKEKDEDLLKK